MPKQRLELEVEVKALSVVRLAKIGAAITALHDVREASEALTDAVNAAGAALKVANEAMRVFRPPGLMERIADYITSSLRRPWPGDDGG